jgi:hypothetical protein
MTVYGPAWYQTQYDRACSRLTDFEKKKDAKVAGARGSKIKLATIERRHARLKKCVEIYAEECGIN